MDLLEALFALSRLDALPRTGWIQAGVPHPESVAGHITGVGYLILASASKVAPPLDLGRCLTLALVHDAPECLSGDLPRAASRALPPGAKAQMEASLAADLLAGFPESVQASHREYTEQKTREARFVRACDRLQLAVECLRLLRTGQLGLTEFVTGLRTEDFTEFEPLAVLWSGIRGELWERSGANAGLSEPNP